MIPSETLRTSLAQTVSLFGYDVTFAPQSALVDWVTSEAESQPVRYLTTMNVAHVCSLARDPAFRLSYDRAALIVPDGMPIYWIGRWRTGRKTGRVAGSSLLPDVFSRCADAGLSVYIIGGRPKAVSQMWDRLESLYPKLRIVGWDAGMFDERKDTTAYDASISRVAAMRPAVVVVALGVPKQELWCRYAADKLDSGVLVPIGAGLEYALGMRMRAPRFLQQSGLEWLWRLGCEPRRLWARYSRDSMRFALLLAKTRLGRRSIHLGGGEA